MRYSQLSCSKLLVCTAIICLDSKFSNYSFFHIKQCTPTSLNLNPNLHLIPQYNNYLQIEHKHATKGFICSHCARSNFFLYNSSRLDKCSKEIAKIELRHYCKYSSTYTTRKNICQCLSTNETIELVRHWLKPIVKLGKSHMNTNRVNQINASSSYFVYFLIGFIFSIIIFGGMIAMIFNCIKLKFTQLRTLK